MVEEGVELCLGVSRNPPILLPRIQYVEGVWEWKYNERELTDHNAQTLPTRNNAKAVKEAHKEHLTGPR